MHVSAATSELVVLKSCLRVLDSPPSNLTGALVEFTWSTVTSRANLDEWGVSLHKGGLDNTMNETRSGDHEVVRMRVNGSAWNGGALWVCYAPLADERPVAAVLEAEVTIHVTTFAGGPPDWSFSAVAPS